MDHYENFPVASILCPPRLRPAIAAIYGFARTADDIADEGDAPAVHRLGDLAAFRKDLLAIEAGEAYSDRWPQVFAPLQREMRKFQLPSALFEQLLDAFEQDVRFTNSTRRYQTDAELMDYCKRSANPVGRLLLHLYDIGDAYSLAQSDLICSALQLINFWQDISVDFARKRCYLTAESMRRHGVVDADLQADSESSNAAQMVADCVSKARGMMQSGASLACRIPGRAGWELRLVVQGGLRVLDKITAINFTSWRMRPKLGLRDVPILLWRAWRMQ